jgi:predicted membrane protein
MISYGKIFLVICGYLIFRHFRNPLTSQQSRRVVLVVGCVVAILFFLKFTIPYTLLAMGLGIYIILYPQLATTDNNSLDAHSPKEPDAR